MVIKIGGVLGAKKAEAVANTILTATSGTLVYFV
jgi:hypothetical protein